MTGGLFEHDGLEADVGFFLQEERSREKLEMTGGAVIRIVKDPFPMLMPAMKRVSP